MALHGGGPSVASTTSIPDSDFESGSFGNWQRGAQTGSLGATITGNGTGVTLFSGGVTFSATARAAVGNPTFNGAPNIYYAPAVEPAVWNFAPNGSNAVALQAKSGDGVQFNDATTAVGLTAAENQAIKDLLVNQKLAAVAAGGAAGDANPTNAAWIRQSVTLSAGITYSMSWNYLGTDYAPFNDGSITSLVTTSATAASVVTVNNSVGRYALLGFTNPGTGDYSTGSFGSTGWQIATYQVTVTGEYVLGFLSFNLGDQSLSPVLLVDDAPGTTTRNGQAFGAVASNNPNAPQVGTTTTTTEAPAVTTTPCCFAPVLPEPTEAPARASSPPTEAPTTAPPSTATIPTTLPPETARPTVPGSSIPAAPVSQAPGSLPSLPVGQSVATQNGQPVPMTIQEVSRGAWQLSGDGFLMTLAVPLPGGGSTSAGGEVTLVQNRTVDVSGIGFQPGTLVDVWLFSTPRFLGTVRVKTDGTFDGTLNLPPDVPVGSHTLQANGVTTDSQVRSLNLGVRVVASNPRLPVTGDSMGPVLQLAILVSAVGVIGWSSSRLRRRGASA